MRRLLWLGCVAAVGLGASCVGTERARARDQLAGLRESLRLAELRGVGRDPRAADQLKQAHLRLREGETWLQRDPYRAISGFSCAQTDTDLAVALEDESRARIDDRRVSRSLEVPSQEVVP